MDETRQEDSAAPAAAEPASTASEPAPSTPEPTTTVDAPRRRFAPWVRRAALALLALLGLALLGQLLTWPDVARLAKENPRSTAFMDSYRHHTGQAPRQQWVPYQAISQELKRAVLVSEDLEFFSHNGFSTHEIKAALKAAWEEGKPLRGASTLTQQLAKNLWLAPSRNPWRKVKEAILTRQIEQNLEKRRILEIYLNVVEFGPGIYGAEAAAQHYFGRTAAALTRRQAAQLAAALPSPAHWNPAQNSRTAHRRTERILVRMGEAGWLDKVL